MSKIDLPNLFKTQISLTEWFEKADHKLTEEFRQEETTRIDRQQLLNKIANIPFDKSTKFEATDLKNNTESFQAYFNQHQDELCALRLVPKNPKDPKIRMRGLTISDVMEWFKQQSIDPKDYTAYFIPHTDNALFSAIFIINQKGIFGEVIKGLAFQLTQGFHETEDPISFTYDFKRLKLSKDDKDAKDYISEILQILKVDDAKQLEELKKQLNVNASAGYLQGYYETIKTVEFGHWLLDFNRVLGKMYQDFYLDLTPSKDDTQTLTGRVGSPGKVQGTVKIVKMDNLENADFNEGEILVCEMTTPNHLPLMKRSSGIITDLGGILSHAAIVSRELNIPCLTNTKTATQILKDGDLIELDANLGTVTKL